MPRRLIVASALAAVSGISVLLFLFELAYWERVVPGVTALGLDVGGMPLDAARTRLQPRAAEALDRPLVLSIDGWERRTSPRELGLRLAASEIAGSAYAVGRAGNPISRLLDQVDATVRRRAIDPLGEYDRGAMETFVHRLAGELNRPARNASLTLTADLRPAFTSGQRGLEMDVVASAQAISRALGGRLDRVRLVAREVEPSLTDDALELARRELQVMLAGPLTLTFRDLHWRLELPEIAAFLSLEHRAGQAARVHVNEPALRKRIEQIAEELRQAPQDARFDWTRSGLKVLRESRDGRELGADAAVKSIVEALRSGERQVALPVRVTPAAVSSEEPARLGIKELVEHTKTSFAGSIDEKKHNIKLSSERLNGVVVPPGALFSFNNAVGATTLAAGFKWGFGITTSGESVKTVPSVAGGICQVATTLFQSVFWAGYQLEERHWHLYWIPAYTSREVVGLDATVDEEAGLDFKFINPTSHYLLIQTWTEGDELHFALYGQKPSWKVEVDPAVISNRAPPVEETVFEAAPTLPWGRKLQVESAREGFQAVTVRRVIVGSDVRTLRLKSTYRPSRNVHLIGTQGAPPNKVEATLASARAADSAQNKPVRGDGQTAGAEATPKPASPQTTSQPTAAPKVVPTSTSVATATAVTQPTAVPTPRPTQPATATPQSTAARPTATPQAPRPSPKPQP